MKYIISNNNFYNFDDISFIIKIIYIVVIVIDIKKYNRSKLV